MLVNQKTQQLISEIVEGHEYICIATKRGLCSVPHFIWYRYGVPLIDSVGPFVDTLKSEIQNFVDVLYIGDHNKKCIARLNKSGNYVTIANHTAQLDKWYKSYDA